MSLKQIIFFAAYLFASAAFAQKSNRVSSPDGNVVVTIAVHDSIYYSIAVDGKEILSPSSIALLTDRFVAGISPGRFKISHRSTNEIIVNPVPFKRREIPDNFNELVLDVDHDYSIEFRAYNDGVAYRFISHVTGKLHVISEVANFRFPSADTVYMPLVQQRQDADAFHTSFEEPYQKGVLSSFQSSSLAFSPVLIHGRTRLLITESDLLDYPGMFLRAKNTSTLEGVFAPFPKREEIHGGEFKQYVVEEREQFLAEVDRPRSFPWRVVAMARTDADLVLNDLVYRLASPPEEQSDWSWVKPGISTEEWIAGSNIYGVDFESGINTETYKYYIDFASRFGFQYVMLDAGWSDTNDLLKVTKGLDLEAIAAYAKSKNISLILWTLAMTLDRQLEPALDMFGKLGVKCIITDFMDRDDQKMLRFYERIARATAAKKMMVMFHGAFKNAGFERTYPHIITREAVLGSEYNIWSDKATPGHDLLIPFIRMVAGPMDYEPGFYVNANKRTFKPLPDKVMSQGTRCHQLAMFVIYESPLQMFSGNPSDAYPEVDFTTYLASLPTTWDETKVLRAQLGHYLVIARRKDSDWYLAAMTDWSARTIKVDLSFLSSGDYRAFSVKDGKNAGQHASDYRMGYDLVNASDSINIEMAPGGGYVVKLIKLNDARP